MIAIARSGVRGGGRARFSRALSGVPYSKMSVGVPKETAHLEKRVAQTPETVQGLVKEGFTVNVEKGAGEGASFPDAAYAAAGAKLTDTAGAYASTIITKVAVPTAEEAKLIGDKASALTLARALALCSCGLSPTGARALMAVYRRPGAERCPNNWEHNCVLSWRACVMWPVRFCPPHPDSITELRGRAALQTGFC